MHGYIRSARRYRWLIVSVLTIVWGAGAIAAYVDYTTTFESEAIIWGQRPPPELASGPADPSLSVVQTPATQQAALLTQLFQTESFLREVVARTSLQESIRGTVNEKKTVEDVRKRLRAQALGTNLLSVSFTARDPRIAYEVVIAALALRGERVTQSRVAATASISALYQKELEVTQGRALDLQRQLDEFNESHAGPLTEEEQHRRDQLRLALDFVQIRLGDLRGRIDQALIAPALLDVSGVEFQVLDEPTVERSPRGGAKPAASIAGVAAAAGLLLAALVVLLGTLLSDRLAGSDNIAPLAPARLFATVPYVPEAAGRRGRDARTALAAIAFEDDAAARRARVR